MVAAIVKFYNNINEKKNRPFCKNTKGRSPFSPKSISNYPLPQKNRVFYSICRLQRSILAKNPVSEILINDCARGRRENDHDLHENARHDYGRDRHDYVHDRHENVRDPGQPNSDLPPQPSHSTTLQSAD